MQYFGKHIILLHFPLPIYDGYHLRALLLRLACDRGSFATASDSWPSGHEGEGERIFVICDRPVEW